MNDSSLLNETQTERTPINQELFIQQFIVGLDQKQPWQRLESLISLFKKEDRVIVREGLYLSLVSLYVIDEIVRESENTGYFFYIQDDYSVLNLLEMSGYFKLDKQMFNTLVIQLGLAQLVYRFNAAKKFRLANPNTKQLRLNSWGRSILADDIIDHVPEMVLRISQSFRSYYEKNVFLYKELTHLLLKEITPVSAKRIQEINQELKIKLVS